MCGYQIGATHTHSLTHSLTTRHKHTTQTHTVLIKNKKNKCQFAKLLAVLWGVWRTKKNRDGRKCSSSKLSSAQLDEEEEEDEEDNNDRYYDASWFRRLCVPNYFYSLTHTHTVDGSQVLLLFNPKSVHNFERQ